MSSRNTDRMEHRIVLRVSRALVWHALADAEEFGAWIGAKLERPFTEGATVKGRITKEGHRGVPLEMTIDTIEPERLFSWRWHPYAVDPELDYSAERPTRVVCELEEVGPGTALTVVESGFDGIPATRRAEAYRMHEEGWPELMKSLERYLARAA